MDKAYSNQAECKEIHWTLTKKDLNSGNASAELFALTNIFQEDWWKLKIEKLDNSQYKIVMSFFANDDDDDYATYLDKISMKTRFYHKTYSELEYLGSMIAEEKTDANNFNFSILIDGSGYFKSCYSSDTFIIKAEIRPTDNEVSEEAYYYKRAKNVNIPALPNLEILFNSCRESDATLVSCDNTVFQAHRCIIAAASPVFEAMLDSQMIEGITKEIKFDEMDGETLSDLLKSIYSDSFEITSIDQALSLIQIADMYDLQKLKFMCVKYLDENYSHENVLEILILADRYNEKTLSDNCIRYIQMHFLELQYDKNWVNLNANLSFKIIKFIHSNQTPIVTAKTEGILENEKKA